MDLPELVEFLKKEIKTKEYLDVGHGTERTLGVSAMKLRSALAILTGEGYIIYHLKMKQAGNGHEVVVKVIAKNNRTNRDWAKVNDAVQSGKLRSVEVKV